MVTKPLRAYMAAFVGFMAGQILLSILASLCPPLLVIDILHVMLILAWLGTMSWQYAKARRRLNAFGWDGYQNMDDVPLPLLLKPFDFINCTAFVIAFFPFILIYKAVTYSREQKKHTFLKELKNPKQAIPPLKKKEKYDKALSSFYIKRFDQYVRGEHQTENEDKVEKAEGIAKQDIAIYQDYMNRSLCQITQCGYAELTTPVTVTLYTDPHKNTIVRQETFEHNDLLTFYKYTVGAGQPEKFTFASFEGCNSFENNPCISITLGFPEHIIKIMREVRTAIGPEPVEATNAEQKQKSNDSPRAIAQRLQLPPTPDSLPAPSSQSSVVDTVAPASSDESSRTLDILEAGGVADEYDAPPDNLNQVPVSNLVP